MSMNIYRQEFKMNLRSVITWSVAVAVLILVFVSLFSSFSLDAALLDEMMANFPEELLAAFGILTSKLLAALSGLIITDVVVWIASFVFINMFKGDATYETGSLALLLLSIVPFQLVFLSVGLVISLLVKRIRSVTPYAMALAFGMYVLSAFGDMLGEAALEKITPFKHFEPNYIIQHGAYDLPLVLISVSAIVISLVGSYLLYARRDIPAAV
jgi:ABC-2 type transport system permease protein